LYDEEHDKKPNSGLYFPSEKVLGRSVDNPKLLNEWGIKVGENKNGPRKAWEEIKVTLESMGPSFQGFLC